VLARNDTLRSKDGPEVCNFVIGFSSNGEWQYTRTVDGPATPANRPTWTHYCRRCGLPKDAILMWCAWASV